MIQTIEGQVVEIGRIDPPTEAQNGFVLKLSESKFITVSGFTEDETREFFDLLCANCFITIAEKS